MKIRIWILKAASGNGAAIALFKDDTVLRWAKTAEWKDCEFGSGESFAPPPDIENPHEAGQYAFNLLLQENSDLGESPVSEFNVTAELLYGRG